MTLLRIGVVTLLLQAPLLETVPSASIEGIVVRAGTDDPLPKVTVTLVATGAPVTAVTAADGRFAFSKLGPGSYLLSASATGFVSADSSGEITLGSGQKVSGIRLPMKQTGAISGRILDNQGEPVMRALVTAQRFAYHTGVGRLVTVQAVLSNDLGEYRLFWLPPGQYLVSATLTDPKAPELPVLIAPGSAGIFVWGMSTGLGRVTSRVTETGSQVEESAVPVYYPGTPDSTAAARIEVRSGGEMGGIDIVASPVRVYRVRGRVVNGATGTPAPEATVNLVQKNNDGPFLSIGAPRRVTGGAFEIAGVPAGSYLLTTEFESMAHSGGIDLVGFRRSGGAIPITVANSDLDNVTIAAQPPYNVSGRVLLEGQPVATSSTGGRAAQVVLRAEGRSGSPFETTATVARDGSFGLVTFLTGEFQVFLRNHTELGFVKSIRLGPSDGLYGRIQMNGAPQIPLEIVVNPNAASLEGTVVNARREPVFNAVVALVPEGRFRDRPDLFINASTDSAGRFRLRGIAPGIYAVFAWEDAEQGAWLDPEFLRLYENQGRPVSFVEGSDETVELSVIPYR